MFGNLPPFFFAYGAATANGPGILTTSAQNILGPKTWITAHTDGAAENPLALWRLDEDTTSDLRILNDSAANAVFRAAIKGTQSTTGTALAIYAAATTDTGANAVMRFDSRTAANTAIATRPLYEWDNAGTAKMTMAANGCLDVMGGGRFSGAQTISNNGGAIEVLFTDPNGSINCYNRQTATWKALALQAVTIALNPSGTTSFTVAATVNTNAVPMALKSYTVATLPAASVGAGALAYASDAAGNGPCIAMSNGTNWKRCDNTATTVA